MITFLVFHYQSYSCASLLISSAMLYDHISCISLPVVQLCLTADIIGNVVLQVSNSSVAAENARRIVKQRANPPAGLTVENVGQTSRIVKRHRFD